MRGLMRVASTHKALQSEAIGLQLDQNRRIRSLRQGNGKGPIRVAEAGNLHPLGAVRQAGQGGTTRGVGSRASVEGRDDHRRARHGGMGALVADQHAQQALGRGDRGTAQQQRRNN